MKTCIVYRKLSKLHKNWWGKDEQQESESISFIEPYDIQIKDYGKQNKTPIPPDNLSV